MVKQGELFQLCCPNCGRHLAGIVDEKGCVKIVCDRCGAKIISKRIKPSSCTLTISLE